MAASASTRPLARPASSLIWTPFILLCLIGAAAALRRILELLLPPSSSGPAALQMLDTHFAARKALTLAHLFPALAFVLILPLWFSSRIRARDHLHRRITVALFILGAVIGVTALLLSTQPVGGVTEQSAVLFYLSLYLFALARAFIAFISHQSETHPRGPHEQVFVLGVERRWMMRAIAVILGVAATRPVMGVFFATAPRTHMTPHQFFGIAFWIGFTVTYLAGELYLRTHPTPHAA